MQESSFVEFAGFVLILAWCVKLIEAKSGQYATKKY